MIPNGRVWWIWARKTHRKFWNNRIKLRHRPKAQNKTNKRSLISSFQLRNQTSNKQIKLIRLLNLNRMRRRAAVLRNQTSPVRMAMMALNRTTRFRTQTSLNARLRIQLQTKRLLMYFQLRREKTELSETWTRYLMKFKRYKISFRMNRVVKAKVRNRMTKSNHSTKTRTKIKTVLTTT